MAVDVDLGLKSLEIGKLVKLLLIGNTFVTYLDT